jgi:hypothetical protein
MLLQQRHERARPLIIDQFKRMSSSYHTHTLSAFQHVQRPRWVLQGDEAAWECTAARRVLHCPSRPKLHVRRQTVNKHREHVQIITLQYLHCRQHDAGRAAAELAHMCFECMHMYM